MTPMFSWPMMTGAVNGGLAYIFTSVPQMPATSTLSSAPSPGMSGIGNSRSSVRARAGPHRRPYLLTHDSRLWPWPVARLRPLGPLARCAARARLDGQP